ncbi:MAG: glycoside hydrolase family 18 protein [Micromonosporaceae bacterium]
MTRHHSRRLLALATAVLLPLTLAGTASAQPHDSTARYGSDADKKLVGYFTQWGIYGRNYLVKNLETSGQAGKLTHVNYAFGNVSAEGNCFEANIPGQGDAWADYQTPFSAEQSVDGVADTADQPLAGNFNQLRELKQKHPKLKVLISLGGWTWSRYFSDAALTPESRQKFVASCVDLFIKGNLPLLDGRGGPGSAAGVFDGIDLDWEWPASEGAPGNVVRPEDKQNFTALVAEFRRQLDAYGRQQRKHYQLTAFLPADPAQAERGIETRKVFRNLDFATIQGYDLNGAWDPTTNHHSQLFSPPDDPNPHRFSVDLAIRHYLQGGAPARKLVMGVPYYGRGWTGVPDRNRGLYQGPATPAPGTYEPGYEDYKVIATKPGNRYYDHRAVAVWYFDGTTFWTYDDPQVIRVKTRYIKARGLGGAMVWSLDGDDAQGTLTSALHSGLT